MIDGEAAREHVKEIGGIAGDIGRRVTVMEVCGGHTNVIMRYGLREMLPKNVRLISGPGCPVCVCSQHDVDSVVRLAKEGVPVATYGDMMRVPGSADSLESVKAGGGRVFEVYSATEALELRGRHPGLVFFGVGFETTAPMTAYLLANQVCVYSAHKLMPPAIRALAADMRIDGFLNPGHVSTIIGVSQYRAIKAPQVVAGFTPERVLRALRILLELIRDGRNVVVNGYPEAVREEGNLSAQAVLKERFHVCDGVWRGLGGIPSSGLEVRDGRLNAKVKYADILSKVKMPKESGCRCGDILKGLLEPAECPLYKRKCTPEHPMGACMVSSEGSCAMAYRYGG